MDLSRRTELLEGVVNELIDEEALGVCLEMHRAIKLGYYELLYPEDKVYEKRPIVDVKGLDIFGSTPLSIKKNIDCLCPNCSRTLGAQKFAPHLEKCMGMGRNSTRLAATKKPKAAVESDPEGSDEEEEWTYPEGARNSKGTPKKFKKDSLAQTSLHKSGRGPGRPPKQHKQAMAHSAGETDFHSMKPSQMMHTVHSFKTLPMEHKISLLDQICGVVSERTGRLCTRSVNCPQHSEDQRMELRSSLLADRRKSIELHPPPAKKSRSIRKPSPEVTDEVEVENSHHTPSRIHSASRQHLSSTRPFHPSSSRPTPPSHFPAPSHHPAGPTRLHPPSSQQDSSPVRKNKSSKKSKRHGITTTTVLQSSPMF